VTPAGRQPDFRDASPLETESHLIRQASAALRAGEVVVIPTDTVYGLAAAVDRPDALSRLYALKKRPRAKAIPVLLSDPSQVDQVSTGLSKMAKRLALSFWPGGLTLVLPALSHLPSHVTSIASDGLRTVAVRVPDHPLACAIIRASGGALAVTSANESGKAPALEAWEAAALGASPPILVIDGGRVPKGIPSTVVLATGAGAVILREGAISAAAIAAALGDHDMVSGGGASAGYDQPMATLVQQTGVADRTV
jgi:L-threonylcarbamoyladenylate synthase